TKQEVRAKNLGVAPVTGIAFSSNGRFLVVAHKDGTAERWDGVALAARRNTSPLTWHTSDEEVTSIAFSRDGRKLAIGGSNGLIQIVSPDMPNNILLNLGVRGTKVYSLTFSQDGQWLAAGTSKGVVTFYPISIPDMAKAVCHRIIRNLSHKEWLDFV